MQSFPQFVSYHLQLLQATCSSSLDPAIPTSWAPCFFSYPLISSLPQEPDRAFQLATHFLWLPCSDLTHGFSSYSELIQAPFSYWRWPYHLTPGFLGPQFLPTHCHVHKILNKPASTSQKHEAYSCFRNSAQFLWPKSPSTQALLISLPVLIKPLLK